MILNFTDQEVVYIKHKLNFFNTIMDEGNFKPYYGIFEIRKFDLQENYQFLELISLTINFSYVWMNEEKQFAFEIENYQQFKRVLEKVKFKACID